MFHRMVKWMTAPDHVRDVARLDDRLLADIGIERDRIRRALRGEPDPVTAKPQAAGDGPGCSDHARRVPGIRAVVPAGSTRREPAR